MADFYESRHTGQEIDDAIDRAKDGGAIDKAIEGRIDSSKMGQAFGVATLGEDALLSEAQRPKAGGLYRDDGSTTVEASLADISTTLQKKADLGEDGKVPAEQVDAYSKSDSISAETRTALSLSETATPDAALAEIARQLSESWGLKLTKLWENASPGSGFGEQTITIDLSAYQYVMLNMNYNYWWKFSSIMIKVPSDGYVVYYCTQYTDRIYSRQILVYKDKIVFQSPTNASTCIPFEIFGVNGVMV